jgi:hypothetical protein
MDTSWLQIERQTEEILTIFPSNNSLNRDVVRDLLLKNGLDVNKVVQYILALENPQDKTQSMNINSTKQE